MAVLSATALTGITTRMADTAMSAGSILQVVSNTKTDVTSRDATTFDDIAGTDQAGSGSVFCVKITPSSTSNKILIYYTLNMGSAGTLAWIKLLRDSTAIFIGDSATDKVQTSSAFFGSTATGIGMYGMAPISGIHLDSSHNSTSELTYKFQWKVSHSGWATYLNRSHHDDTSTYNARGASSITVMEVAV